jgi:hypothetical protein
MCGLPGIRKIGNKAIAGPIDYRHRVSFFSASPRACGAYAGGASCNKHSFFLHIGVVAELLSIMENPREAFCRTLAVAAAIIRSEAYTVAIRVAGEPIAPGRGDGAANSGSNGAANSHSDEAASPLPTGMRMQECRAQGRRPGGLAP